MRQPLSSPPSIEPASSPATIPPSNIELLWPSVTFEPMRQLWTRSDHRRVPDRFHIDMRRREIMSNGREPSDLLALEAFIDAMAAAEKQIWILDPKFDTSQAGILEAVVGTTDATDIRLLTETHGADERMRITSVAAELTNLANNRSPRPPARITVEWRPVLDKNNYPFLHDRFAIVDRELWHFGATVGGGHHGLNAASRGWDAIGTRAITFFQELWNEASDVRPRHAAGGRAAHGRSRN